MFRGRERRLTDMRNRVEPRSTSGSVSSSRSASPRSCFSRSGSATSSRSAAAPGYRLEAQLRQHRRLEAARAGEGGRRGRRPRGERSSSTPSTYQAVVTLRIDQGYEFTDGHDRVDPDVRSAGRGLHRARPGRRPEDARRRRQDHQDAIGGRPREADRPVSVRQGRKREAASDDALRCGAAASHARAVRCWRCARRRLRERRPSRESTRSSR